MANTYQNCRIQLRTDAPTTWSQYNPVLANGEIGLVKSGQNYDFVVGDGSTRYNNLKKVISENPSMISVTNSVNACGTRIDALQTTVDNYGQNIAENLGRFDLELQNNYTTSKTLLTEVIPGTDMSKSSIINDWKDWMKTSIAPRYRLTDAVSWDSIFIILLAMMKAGIVDYNETRIDTFGTRLVEMLPTLATVDASPRRVSLDLYRDEIL